jgi:hypothetical protein
VETLKTELVKIRVRLEKNFSSDTALNGLQSIIPSTGHCASVAAIVWKTFGGLLMSANINGVSHWFNRIQIDDQLVDFDLTGDQFGYPMVQMEPAGKLYSNAWRRSPEELNDDTLRRAVLLARRAGFFEAAESLEKRHQSKKQIT